MASFRSKKIIEQYRTNLSNKIQYLRTIEGGELILRLLELMMTAIDYDKDSKPIHRLIRDVGCQFGAGYENTPDILRAALTYAEFSLRQNKIMTVEAWRDTMFAFAVCLESHKNYMEEKVREMEKVKASGSAITKEMACKVNWRELTEFYNLDKIKEAIDKYGKNNHDKKIIVEAIYEEMSSSNELYKIPYNVDALLTQLHKECEENGRGQLDIGGVRREKKENHSPQVAPPLHAASINKCFKYPNDFTKQHVKKVVKEFYNGSSVNLALIEIVLFDHCLLKKRNEHTDFVKSLIHWGIIDDDRICQIKQIANGMSSKVRALPKEGYLNWDEMKFVN